MIDLLVATSDKRARALSDKVVYAVTQWLVPHVGLSQDGELHLSPLLDLLDVKYLIFRGDPPSNARPAFVDQDYWVMENRSAVGRVFVPRRVEVCLNRDDQIGKMTFQDFQPLNVAYVETPVDLPESCTGSAQVLMETSTRIIVGAQMETPGLVILTDRWDAGWKAYVEGKRAPILVADHALRGVVLPAGPSRVEFRYEPDSFSWGLRLAGGGAAGLLIWLFIILRKPQGAKVSQTEA
jgi:hypothetical protein